MSGCIVLSVKTVLEHHIIITYLLLLSCDGSQLNRRELQWSGINN